MTAPPGLDLTGIVLDGFKFDGFWAGLGWRKRWATAQEMLAAKETTLKHSSWLNQIEIWFDILVRHVLKRSSFLSAAD